MYNRHTLASIESILFLAVLSIWLLFNWFLFSYIAHRGFDRQLMTYELLFSDVFLLVLIIWFVFALIGFRTNEGYDLNRFRTWPLPLNTIFFANLFSAFLDLSILPPLVAFLAVFVAAGPTFSQFVIGLVFILAFLFFLVIAVQTIAILLYVMLPRVSTVKLFTTVMIGILIWSIILGLGGFRHPESHINFFAFFVPSGIEYFRHYPTGEMGIMLSAVIQGNWGDIWIYTTEYTIRQQTYEYSSYPLLGFLGWTFGILAFNYLLHAAWMSADIRKHVEVGRVQKHDIGALLLNGFEKILSPIIGATAFELYRKDMLEYAFRSPYFLVYKFLPGTIAPIIIVLAMQWNLNPQSGLIDTQWRAISLMTTVILILFIVIGQANLFAGNQFGFEDANIRGLMMFPTPRKEFLLGKNLFFAGLFILDAVILSALSLIFFPKIIIFFATLTLMLTIFLIILSIGNFTSSIWPYWMPLDKPSFTFRTTVILGIVNLGVTVALAIAVAPAAAVVIVPYIFKLYWLSCLMMPVAVIYGIYFHKLTMKHAVALFESNEFLILRRVADREQF